MLRGKTFPRICGNLRNLQTASLPENFISLCAFCAFCGQNKRHQSNRFARSTQSSLRCNIQLCGLGGLCTKPLELRASADFGSGSTRSRREPKVATAPRLSNQLQSPVGHQKAQKPQSKLRTVFIIVVRASGLLTPLSIQRHWRSSILPVPLIARIISTLNLRITIIVEQ